MHTNQESISIVLQLEGKTANDYRDSLQTLNLLKTATILDDDILTLDYKFDILYFGKTYERLNAILTLIEDKRVKIEKAELNELTTGRSILINIVTELNKVIAILSKQ